jgi:hypothetical protein
MGFEILLRLPKRIPGSHRAGWIEGAFKQRGSNHRNKQSPLLHLSPYLFHLLIRQNHHIVAVHHTDFHMCQSLLSRPIQRFD